MQLLKHSLHYIFFYMCKRINFVVEVPIPPQLNTDCSLCYHLYPTHRWFHMPLLGHETGIRPLSTFLSESEHQKITGSKRNSFQTHHQHISHAFCLAEKKKKKSHHSTTALSSLNHSNFILPLSSNQKVCQHVTFSLLDDENNKAKVTRQHELFRGTTGQN